MSQATEPLILPVEADDAQFQAKMDSVENRLSGIASKAVALGTKMSLAITTPLSLMSAKAVSSFSEFDEAMTKSTSILSGMSEENRKQMESTAKSIASTTRTSAAKAAEAYYFLASAGMDAKQAIGALPLVEKFATAGAFDMARATELLADSQSALGLSMGDTEERMKQMARVSDVLVDAGNMSNASVEQFAKALTTKSAAALRGMNKEVEEGVAILAIYADAGIKGEAAGEKLSIMLRESQNAVLRDGDAWQKMGMTLYDTNGNMKNLADVVKMLEDATKGMSDQQKVATFDMLGFKSESIDAIRPLLGMSQKIKDYETRLRSAGGATGDVADKQMKSFSAQLDILKNQINLAAIELGQVLAPSLLKVNQNIATGLNYWRSLSDETKQFTVGIGKLLAFMGPTLVVLGKMTQTAITLKPFLSSMYVWLVRIASGAASMVAAFAVANPITAVLLGVGSALAGIAYWLVGAEGITNAWNTATSATSQFTSNAIGMLTNFSQNSVILSQWIGTNWRAILIDMGSATVVFTNNMATNFGVGLKTGMRLFAAFYGWLYGTSERFFTWIFSDKFKVAVWNGMVKGYEAVKDFSTRSWENIKVFSKGAGEMFMALGIAAVGVLSKVPTMVFNILSKTGAAFIKAMKMILSGNMPDISAFLSEVSAAASDEFKKATEAAGKAIEKTAAGIGNALSDITTQVSQDFNDGMSDPNFFNTAQDILSEGINEMVSPLEGFNATTAAPEFIKGTQDIAKEASNTGTAIAEMSSEMQTASDSAASGVNAASDAVKDLNKEASKKIRFDIGNPVAGVEAFTSEAMQAWAKYQKVAKEVANPSSPPNPEAQAKAAASLAGGMAIGVGGLMGAVGAIGASALPTPVGVSNSNVISTSVDTGSISKSEQYLSQIAKNTSNTVTLRVASRS